MAYRKRESAREESIALLIDISLVYLPGYEVVTFFYRRSSSGAYSIFFPALIWKPFPARQYFPCEVRF